MKPILVIAACAMAAVLPACGSSRPVVTPQYHGADSLTFVADGPSTAAGVDNTDLFAVHATPTPVVVIDVRGGRVSTVAVVPDAATDPSWSSR